MLLRLLLILALVISAAAQTVKLNELEVRKGQELQKQSQMHQQAVATIFAQHAKITANMSDPKAKAADAKVQKQLADEQVKQAAANDALAKWCSDVMTSRKQDVTKMTCDWDKGQLVSVP